VTIPLPVPEAPPITVAQASLLVADQAHPLGDTASKVSVPPNWDAKALTGLTDSVEQAAVASEILVRKAPYVPVGSAVDVMGKPPASVYPVTKASPTPSVATP
jgi:hypothetical protein